MEILRNAADSQPQLQDLLLAFVVKTQGTWTSEALVPLHQACKQLGLKASDAEFEQALVSAKKTFRDGHSQLFICDGRICRKRRLFNLSSSPSAESLCDAKVGVNFTECQGPCKHAPIATLRTGNSCAMFAEFPREIDFSRIAEFSIRAKRANTHLVDIGSSKPYQFDPVHQHGSKSNRLAPFEFLIGHFYGEGICESNKYRFAKEVVGAWEMGGRFISLRMSATYNLQNGLKDTHQALIILGVDCETGNLESRSYTDAGFIRDYQIALQDQSVIFSDAVPHSTGAQQARKSLTPTAHGYDEILELDYGNGDYQTYYHVRLQLQNG